VRDETGALLGAAVWERSEVGRDSALLAQIPYAVRFLVALGPRGVLRAYRVQRALERFRPLEPHWYLMTCGVRTDAQGAGIGGDLLRHRLRLLDEEGAAAYLESTTSDDRRLFDALGFVPGAKIQGLPTARPTAMFRTPARRPRRSV
jgi:GNAT superfamily N-acetyltransferase